MSDSVRPHRRQPIRLHRPWDSPGKNNGVGCHFLLQCMKVKTESDSLSRVRLLATPWTAAHQAPPFMGFSTKNHSSPVLLGWPKSSFRMTELFHQPDRINSRKIIFRHKIINQVGFILRSNASSTSKKF